MLDRVLREIQKGLEVLRPYAVHLSALAIAMLLGLIVAAVKVSSNPPAVDTADRWPLPLWAPYRAGPQRDALARAEIWTADPSKAKTEVAEKKPAGPLWRFIGTVQDGKARIAMIELEQGKRVQRIASGQPLPNGSVIKKIDTGELIYDENGVEKVLKLFSAAQMDTPAAGIGKN